MSVSIIQTIDEEALKFAREFITQRKAALLSRKANASGDLIASLDYEATKQSIDEAASLLLIFADHGRFIDMRNSSIHYDHDKWGRDAMERMQNWVQKKGISNFLNGWLKGRGQTYTHQSYDKIIKSIAWGIVATRTSGRFRRKVWWNKAKSAKINELVNDIAAKLPESAAKDIKNTFTARAYNKARGR